MRYSRWLWTIGLLGTLGVAGCCQTRNGESRRCLLPGFLRSRGDVATLPSSGPSGSSGPVVYESVKPALPSEKESKSDKTEKSPPRMPPVTDLPAAPTPSQRLAPPPPRVPVEASPRLNLPTLPRPLELPTLPPLAAPPEASLITPPGEGTLVIPTEAVVEPKQAATEIIQIGAVEDASPVAAVKACAGEAALLALVKAKSGRPQPVARAALPHAKSAESLAGPGAGARILTGKVQQWRGSWILRYASVDAVDEHGGSVTLFGPAELDRLREGQQVSVQGVLLPAELRHESPRFRVDRVVSKE